MEALLDNCVRLWQVSVCFCDVLVCVCQFCECLLELCVCFLQLSVLLFHWIPHTGLAVLIWQCTHRKIQFDANHVYGTSCACVFVLLYVIVLYIEFTICKDCGRDLGY